MRNQEEGKRNSGWLGGRAMPLMPVIAVVFSLIILVRTAYRTIQSLLRGICAQNDWDDTDEE